MADKKKWIVTSAIAAIIVALIVGGALFLKNYKANINKTLPMTETFDSNNVKMEDVAYKFWFDLIMPYQKLNTTPWARTSDAKVNQFQLLAGDKGDFAIEATFWVKPVSERWSIFHNWGEPQKDGTIQDIHWMMRIKNTGKNKFTLTKIEETSNAASGLVPGKGQDQKKAGVKVPDENNHYLIENGRLKVTYNNGKDWHNVPVPSDALFSGDDSGSRDSLIPESFVITPEKTAFVFVEKRTAKGTARA